jgi:hypothetical protein
VSQIRTRHLSPPSYYVAHPFVASYLPEHLYRLLGHPTPHERFWRQPRPKYDAVRCRIAGSDT